MNIRSSDITEILAFVAKSDLKYVEIEVGDFRMVVSAGELLPVTASPNTPAVVSSVETNQSSEEATRSPDVAVESTESSSDDESNERYVTVRAPMLGTFYRASSPDEPCFAEVGDLIEPDQTLGSIEVMKLYNSMTAGVAGRIVKFFVDSGDLVEFEQPVILIDPVVEP